MKFISLALFHLCVQLGIESLPAEMRLFQLLCFFQPMPQQFGLPDSLFADVKENLFKKWSELKKEAKAPGQQ